MWVIRIGTYYDTSGNLLATRDADGHTNTGHCPVNGTTHYTGCTTYDSTFQMKPIGTYDALDHSTSTSYGTVTVGSSTEMGLWPTSTTDQNGQTSTTSYDALGRETSTKLPGETNPDTTETSYTIWCPSTGANAPCTEVDTLSRLDNTGTQVRSRAFYDGFGRLVETRSQAPGSQDVVTYAKYDSAGHRIFLSQPFFVTAYTGNPGSSAYYVPQNNELGTTTQYNALSQVVQTNTAVGAQTTLTYTLGCNNPGTGDGACYALASTSDPDRHGHVDFTDALGRLAYHQDNTGDVGTSVYRTMHTEYDVLGNVTGQHYADGTHVRWNTYNGLSQLASFSDPDLGNDTISNDANGNVLSIADPRGASGTIFMSYDALNRIQWKGPNQNGSNSYATYNYDEQHPAPNPAITLMNSVGRLTSEMFSSNGVSGYYIYDHDVRGQLTNWHMGIGGTDYLFTTSYNDAGQVTNLHYPDGD